MANFGTLSWIIFSVLVFYPGQAYCNDASRRLHVVFRHARGMTPFATDQLFSTNGQPFFESLRSTEGKKYFEGTERSNIRRSSVNQRLDHFDGTNIRRWDQIYWVNSRYYKKGGPVFLYISSGPVGSDLYWIGGGDALPEWIVKAKKFGAVCFLLEHRYYGDNKPTANLSVPNMRYLNTYQAIADIANFIATATVEHNLANAPWVLFGCSYAGALAAWTKLKYPHLVSIAVASGAPLRPKLDFSEYAEEVTNILKREKKGCIEAISNATRTLESMVTDGGKRTRLKTLFNLCEEVDANDKKNISVFFAHLAENIFNVVQESKVNQGISKHNLTTATICDLMSDTGAGDFVDKYALAQRKILSLYGLPCLSISYKDLILSLRDTRYSQNDDWRQWSFQVCNEFGFYTTSNSPYQPFGHKFDLEYYLDQCTDIFGKWFQQPIAESNIEETLRQYGGSDTKSSKIIFTYGTNDPWRPLGASTVAASSELVLIEGGSHCADFYAPDSFTDTKAMKSARRRVDKLLKAWIQECNGIQRQTPNLVLALASVTIFLLG